MHNTFNFSPYLLIRAAAFLSFFCALSASAQMLNSPALSVMRGRIDFDSRVLYNPNNSNNLASYFNQLKWIQPLNSAINLYAELGLGHYNNMSSDFEPNLSSGFSSYGLGLQLHTKPLLLIKKWQRSIQGLFDLGYTFERIYENKQAYRTKSCPTLHLGGGLWLQLNSQSAIGYAYRVNQRLQQDYRTYNTHQIGFLLNFQSFFTKDQDASKPDL